MTLSVQMKMHGRQGGSKRLQAWDGVEAPWFLRNFMTRASTTVANHLGLEACVINAEFQWQIMGSIGMGVGGDRVRSSTRGS